MRVAAIYDIHGNLPALEAVIEEIRDASVDRIVVGGDVFPGPMPRETLASLRDLTVPVQFIRGNGDREVLARREGQETGAVPEPFREVVRWVAEQMSPEDALFVATWPATLRLAIPDLGEVLFCHATPHNDTDVFTRRTAESRLLPVFEGLDEAVVVCGHTHMPFDRTIGRVRVVNAGSVGMPYGEPGADWLLLGPDIQFRHTAYDLTNAAARVRATNYPRANDFADHTILQPPSVEEILARFTPLEMTG